VKGVGEGENHDGETCWKEFSVVLEGKRQEGLYSNLETKK